MALGTANGHIAYSSFAATNRFLEANPDVALSFVQGFARALRWLDANDASAVGEAIQQFFLDVEPELIVRSVGRYKTQGTWPSDPSLNEPEYQGLQNILMAAGMVQERQPFLKVVRPDIAQEALATHG